MKVSLSLVITMLIMEVVTNAVRNLSTNAIEALKNEHKKNKHKDNKRLFLIHQSVDMSIKNTSAVTLMEAW